MNNFFVQKVLAHEGEEHGSAVEATTHYLDVLLNPYVAIPVFFAVLFLVGFVLNKFNVDKGHVSLVLLVLLFVGGVLGFIFVPPLGIVAIVMGFVYAGLIVMAGIKHS